MKRQYLSNREILSQIAFIKEGSRSLKQYFIRYLAFQNEIVKKIKIDIIEH